MMNRTSRERFGQALLEVQLQELEQICKQYPEDIPVSKRHQRAMRRILRGGHPMRTKVIAILVAAALLLLVGCSIYIARRRIANFFEEVFDTHAKVTTEEVSTTNDPILEAYTLTYVPEGYWLDYSAFTPILNYELWNNGFTAIKFEQQRMESFHYYDLESSNLFQLIQIGDIDICYRYSDGSNQYLWINNDYVCKLDIEEKLQNETIEKIINGVKEKNSNT